MTPNTTPEKPEWFELADAETSPVQVTKANKKLPAIAVLITGAVIATGAFFANASEGKSGDDQAIASVSSSNTNLSSPADSETPQLPTPPKSSTPGKNKIGVPAPGGLNGDHEDGDGHEFGDRPAGERHERGEHGDRNGSAPKIPTATSSPAAGA